MGFEKISSSMIKENIEAILGTFFFGTLLVQNSVGPKLVKLGSLWMQTI